jgi:capsular polysaccharide biosynthesis protein
VQLREYLQIIGKRVWIIVLVTAVAMGVAALVSKLQTPEYRSTIYLNVIPARLDNSLQITTKALMRNYASNIRSRDTATDVINRLQLDITAEQMGAKLTVRPIEEDFMIQIDADDEDPLIARDIAQTTAEVFVEDIKVYMLDQDKRDRVEVNIRDYALPGALHKPKWKINVLAGGVLGLLAGTVLTFVLKWLEAEIMQTPEDVEDHLGLGVLAAIPATASSSRRRGRASAQPSQL